MKKKTDFKEMNTSERIEMLQNKVHDQMDLTQIC